VSPDDPDRADPASEEVVLEVEQPFWNHNGGSIAFGPDGFLYWALGDGGSRDDPFGNGQKLDTLLGKILRLDVDRRDQGKAYAIPPDNPFVGAASARGEIFALGFRNPWQIAFDRATGKLWAADVGQDQWEEVNVVTKGGNYGWSLREGTRPFGNRPEPLADLIDPVWEYDHQIGKSITGGFVYRGRAIPELRGAYLYGDFVSGRLWALTLDEATGKATNLAVPWNGLPIFGFGSDADGDILTYSGPDATTRGSITLDPVTGTFTYTPTADARHGAAADTATDAERTDTFAVTVTDGYGGSVAVPISVTITPANADPSASTLIGEADSTTGAVTGTVSATDTDGDTLTYRVTGGPANGTVTIDAATGEFVYTPDPDARHDVARTPVSEGVIVNGLQTIALSDPTAVTQGTFTSGATGGLFQLSQLSQPGPAVRNYVATFFTATESKTYIFGQTSAPVDTVMVLYTGTFDPASPGTGAIALNDDTSTTDHAAVGATVQGPSGCGSMGYCPQVSANLTAGQVVTLMVTTYSSGQPLGLPQSFYSNGAGDFATQPPPPVNDTFTVEVSDGHGGTTTVQLSVPITPANAEPTATTTAGDPDPGTGTVTGAVLGSDADGDTLTYTGLSTTVRGSLILNPDGTFTYTPTADARHNAAADGAGPETTTDTFTLSITDGYGGQITVPVTVAIGPANIVPVLNPAVGSPDESTGVVTGTAGGTDADGDTLAYSGSTTTAKGTVVIDTAAGTILYTPTAESRHQAAADGAVAEDLSDSFTVMVSDGHGGSDSALVSVVISPANSIPTATADVGTPNAGVVTGSIRSTDADGDTLVFTLASAPTYGSVTLDPVTGAFVYTPNNPGAVDPGGEAGDEAGGETGGGSSTQAIPGGDFESGTLDGWNTGSQTGSLTGPITGSGTGVSIFSGAKTFSAPEKDWTFAPFETYAAALQPAGQAAFDDAGASLGLSAGEVNEIRSISAGSPTDAAWITKTLQLEPGVTYTMAWNYVGTDYEPFNDGSITSLVYLGDGDAPTIKVNNYTRNYALLGFTVTGTGDYSTGSYGSTGWQTSTYEVSQAGTYLLGFAVFNLDDDILSPVLMIDNEPGTTLLNGEPFGAVAPNNPDVPNNTGPTSDTFTVSINDGHGGTPTITVSVPI